jgi:hypothetical protein
VLRVATKLIIILWYTHAHAHTNREKVAALLL